jgi:hypothetical protein
MPAPIYGVDSGGTVALAAATAKTVLGVKAHANSGILLTSFWIGFDGVTASAVPGSIEICYATFATNSPGTASTSVTPLQMSGRAMTVGFTAAKNWTTEPTVLTVLRSFSVTPNGGTVLYDFPLGTELDTALAEGLVIRCNFAAIVNVRAAMSVSRC